MGFAQKQTLFCIGLFTLTRKGMGQPHETWLAMPIQRVVQDSKRPSLSLIFKEQRL